MGAFVGAMAEAVLQVLLPPLCPLCRKEEPAAVGALCPSCHGRVRWLEPAYCERCALPFEGVGPCHPCRRCREEPPAFAVLGVRGRYEGPLLEALRAFKYGGRLDLRRALAGLLVEAFDHHFAQLPRGTPCVPVPCHPETLRRRGFDLPALLSHSLAEARGLIWRPGALKKIAATPDLVGLPAAARSAAVAGAYGPGEPLRGTVLLVDDVVTSTATLRACARACRTAGAEEVVCLALGRTPLAGT